MTYLHSAATALNDDRTTWVVFCRCRWFSDHHPSQCAARESGDAHLISANTPPESLTEPPT